MKELLDAVRALLDKWSGTTAVHAEMEALREAHKKAGSSKSSAKPAAGRKSGR